MAANKKQSGKKAVRKDTGKAKKTAKVKNERKNYLSTYMISLSLITLFLGIFMYIVSEDVPIPELIKSAVCGLFGKVGMLLPVALAGLTIYLGKLKDIKKFWIKFALTAALMINIGAIIGLYNQNSVSDAFFNGANEYIGGGVLGSAVAVGLRTLIGTVASYVLLVLMVFVVASILTSVPIFSYIGKFLKKTAGGAKDKYSHYREELVKEYDDEELYNSNPALDAANAFALDTGKTGKNKEKTGKKDKKIAKKENKIAKTLDISENNDTMEGVTVFSDGIDEVFGSIENEPLTKSKSEKKKTYEESDAEDYEQADSEEKERAEKITEAEKAKYNKELNEAIEKPVVQYVFPPLSLLNDKKATSSDQRDEMRKTAEKLISILDDFGVKAKLLQVTQGPTVTRYEIQPDTGIKLSKIVGLADDLALNLAVSTVLVAPVPGKAAVGVEIPNKKVSSVTIREMMESSEFNGAKSKLTVAIGKDIGGNVVVGDVGKWPHVLIAGATGSGKSVCINTIVTSILYKASPEDVKLIMVDPKVVELGVYNGIPHLLVPVVTDPKKAAGALNWAVTEMMRRYELFKDTGVRKLESYNKLMETKGGEKIPQLVIIIDELADLMMVAAKEVEDYICRLAQLARAAGIHLIIATQRPSVDVITGLIKANIPSRVAFAVSSQVDSRTILDKGGAEKLLGMGDMLYYPTGSRNAMRVQGAFVSDEEIEKIIGFITEHVGETHYSDDLAEHIERCSTGENGVTPDVEEDGDALLPDAISLAVELGKISTSMIQRRLGVGYSRAGRIIDQMEARGIISGANGSKPRDVLVSHADMLSAVGDDEEDEVYEDDYEDDEE